MRRHTTFIPTGEEDRKTMLEAVGAKDFNDLFAGIPTELQSASFNLPDGCSELEMEQHMRGLAAQNATQYVNFCGAGFYEHFIPAAVDTLTSRGEFFTAYTPYQPEASQGTLQAIYEYQTMMARLTGMEISNASLYDGGTALFEALTMSLRCTRRNHVLVDQGVSPIYRTMLRCYTRNLDIGYEEIPLNNGQVDRAAFEAKIDKQTAAVVFQYPNFFGVIEDFTQLIEKAHEVGALGVVSTYPMALSVLKTPGEMGADIVTGEGQSLGIPLSFGGPYLGFMTTRKKFVRKMPGRIAGASKDAQDRRGFVLTLQAREQHIRREKATSNICTNEALCALRAVMYTALMGGGGLVDVASQCARKAHQTRERLLAIDGVTPTFPHPVFNEFAVTLPAPANEVIRRLLAQGIAAGFPVGRYYPEMENVLLVALTEKRTDAQIEQLTDQLEAVLQSLK